ncbi:MAG: hypothetical protein QNK30_07760, partial [Bacteroidales bacterium]|nr:hypothetical protein [Bacteroidales bacterium]
SAGNPPEEIIPEPAAIQPEPAPSSTSESELEEVLTQDIEETVAVPSGKKEEVKKPDPKEIEAERKRQEEIEAERKRQEEIEAERKRQVAIEAERKRQEELERQRKAEEQRKIKEIEDRTKNAFSGKNAASNQSTSEGVTSGTGNQGGIDGSTESKNYSGKGLGNDGISFSLKGRTPQSLPKPDYKYQEDGIVVVEVTVDQNGKVTKATPGVKGSTTLDPNLLSAARKAAIAARFDKNPDAPAFQKGTITYNFVLQ